MSILLADGYGIASVCIVVCVYMATPTCRGGGSVSWQRVPLSRLALPVNRNSAVILYSAVISIIMHCASGWLATRSATTVHTARIMHCRHRDEWAWPCIILAWYTPDSAVTYTYTSLRV